jgi:hypothetical protein
MSPPVRAPAGRDLKCPEDFEHGLPADRNLRVRQVRLAPKAIQGAEALHLDECARHGGLDRPPFA